MRQLKIERQKFSFPAQLSLEGIKCVVQVGQETYAVQLKSLAWALGGDEPSVKLDIQDISFTSSLAMMRGGQARIEFDLKEGRRESLKGEVSALSMNLLGYHATDIYAAIVGQGDELRGENLKASFYGGTIKGQILLDSQPNFPYSIHLEFTHVDLKALEDVNQSVFSKLQGDLQGRIEARGDRGGINLINSSLEVPSGGQLKASLLRHLINYIPQSAQKNELETLMTVDGDVPFEAASLHVKNLSREKLMMDIDLSSQQFNLKLDVQLEVNIEGGFGRFFHFWKEFSSSS
jgi:hypothetical protein